MPARTTWRHFAANMPVTTTVQSSMIGRDLPGSCVRHASLASGTSGQTAGDLDMSRVNWSKPEHSCLEKTLPGSCFSAGGSDGKRSWSSAGRSSVPAEEHHEQ